MQFFEFTKLTSSENFSAFFNHSIYWVCKFCYLFFYTVDEEWCCLENPTTVDPVVTPVPRGVESHCARLIRAAEVAWKPSAHQRGIPAGGLIRMCCPKNVDPSIEMLASQKTKPKVDWRKSIRWLENYTAFCLDDTTVPQPSAWKKPFQRAAEWRRSLNLFLDSNVDRWWLIERREKH